MQPFIKASLKEFLILGSRSTEREHRTRAGRHGTDLLPQEHHPTLQQGEGARALEHQQTSRVISKKESLSKKTPVAVQEGRPGRLREAVTGAWAGAKPHHSPQRAQPLVGIASFSSQPRWPLLHLLLLWSRDGPPARRDVGSMQEALSVPNPPSERTPSAAA